MKNAKVSQAIDALCDAIISECRPEGGSADLTELARIANSLASLISASERRRGKDEENDDQIPKWEPMKFKPVQTDSGHYMVIHDFGEGYVSHTEGGMNHE